MKLEATPKVWILSGLARKCAGHCWILHRPWKIWWWGEHFMACSLGVVYLSNIAGYLWNAQDFVCNIFVFFFQSVTPESQFSPTIPISEAFKQLQFCGNKSGKYPTTKETWPKDDASCKCPAVSCPPDKKLTIFFLKVLKRQDFLTSSPFCMFHTDSSSLFSPISLHLPLK